jgi:hypothetical protein
MMVARELLRELGEALLPQRCIACGRFGAALHQACLETLPAALASASSRIMAPTFGPGFSPSLSIKLLPSTRGPARSVRSVNA